MNGELTMDNKKIAAMFKAFSDENRLQILQLLQDGERCAWKCRLHSQPYHII